jgi:hypothetical protein
VKRLKPLLWPAAVLTVGLLASYAAETAAGRFQNYSLYGLARPVADLLLIIGGVWLVAALIRRAWASARRR